MGLSSFLCIFILVIKCIRQLLQGYTIPLHQCLDDWLIHRDTREQVESHTQTMLHITQKLGFLGNLDKPELQPMQGCTFLSYRFLLGSGKVAPTEK